MESRNMKGVVNMTKYQGKTVCECCENCMRAGMKKGIQMFCRESREWKHEMDKCDKYEFSWQRFECMDIPEMKIEV
jgi:hypothetical protein